MKIIKILLGALIVVAGFISCTKEIELDEITSTGVENIENDEFNAKSDTYKGQVRRCRIRTVYRPKRTLYPIIGIIRGDENQEAQFMQMEFLKSGDGPAPKTNIIVSELKSYNAEKQRSRFVNRRELSFEGDPVGFEYKVKCTALNADKKPIGTPEIFTVVVEDGTQEVEQTEFNVILSSAGAENLKVVDVLLKYTSLSKEEAYKAVYNTPYVVMTRSSKEEANQLKAALEAVGATVDLK